MMDTIVRNATETILPSLGSNFTLHRSISKNTHVPFVVNHQAPVQVLTSIWHLTLKDLILSAPIVGTYSQTKTRSWLIENLVGCLGRTPVNNVVKTSPARIHSSITKPHILMASFHVTFVESNSHSAPT